MCDRDPSSAEDRSSDQRSSDHQDENAELAEAIRRFYA